MKYGACECGGKMVERRIKYVRWFRGQLFEFENVPVGVCLKCGERVFKGTVLERLEELSKNKRGLDKEILVPVGVYN